MFLGTFLVFSMSVVWVLGKEQWRAADPNDPRKILATEVAATLKARAHWFTRNGAGQSASGEGHSAEKYKFNDEANERDLNRVDGLQPPNGESGKP
jgi:hypothetical protein